MKPHRPIELDSFDREFFSSKKENVEEKEPKQEPGQESFEQLPSDVIEAIVNVSRSENSSVFHELPDEEENTFDENVAFSGENVTEEEALKSFPDFKFDPSKFEILSDETNGESADSGDIDAFKAEARREIKEEKEKIKEQQRLEKTVQRPFRAKRILSFFMAVLIIAGILFASFGLVVCKTGSTENTMLKFGDYSLCYVDGENIKSSKETDSLVLLHRESVSGTKTILFPLDGKLMLEEIVARGDGFCAVKIERNDSSIYTVEDSEIMGVLRFSLGNMKGLYNALHNYTVPFIAALALYFAAVIAVFSVLIRSKNKQIKKYRESYQLIG